MDETLTQIGKKVQQIRKQISDKRLVHDAECREIDRLQVCIV